MGGQLALWSSADNQMHSDRTGRGQPRRVVAGERTPLHVKRRLVLADLAAVLFGFLAAFGLQVLVKPLSVHGISQHLLLMVASFPGFAFGLVAARLYQARANERHVEEARNIVRAVGVGVALMVVLAFGLQFKELSRLWIALVALGVTSTLLVERRVARSVFAGLRASGRLSRRIVIVGTDAHAIGLLHTYQRNPSFGYEVVGFVGDDDLGERGGVTVLGSLADLDEILVSTGSVGVVVSLSAVGADEVNILTRRLTDLGYHVALSSSLSDIDVTRLRPQQIDGRTMIYVEPIIRNGWRAIAKRAFDVIGAAAILVITSPALMVAMIAVKFDSAGPVFFRQTRVGRDGATFTLLKLRTMVVDAEQRKAELMEQNEVDGPLFKIANDPRVTRVGRVLRKLSIDELPQLLCVLDGTMSLVGPRPALPSEVEQWDDSLHDRLRVPPGLTGMWQVSGRSASTFEQYRRLDLYYVDNWSLAHDLRICAKTFAVVLSGRGAA